jgi:PPK2 family polyphosphate:nucleotide phosphotransferase
MYAHHRYSVLAIFQAMDAAGKDSTVEHVFTGVNPMGVEVHSFKRPSEDELDHDFLWRSTVKLPARGHIGVFNRSYYEEVLICKVHPEIVQKYQRLPSESIKDMEKLFAQRYQSIRDFEKHLILNGTRVIKFFLNVSKSEQSKRFLDRIEDPSKNWKFNEADLAEREHWDAYQAAYEEAINETATDKAPWYVIPADDKRVMRLLVATILLEELKTLKLAWPEVEAEAKQGMERSKAKLTADK